MRIRCGLCFLSVLLLQPLTACSPGPAADIFPTLADATPTENSATPGASITATPPPTLIPTRSPRTAIQMDGFMLASNGAICPLKPVEFYDLYVFQADCPERIYLPQGTTITLRLLAPEDEPILISAVPNLEAIFGGLEPPFLFCQFDSADAENRVTFGVPFQQTTGRDILCGFSIALQGEEVIIVLTGLTTR